VSVDRVTDPRDDTELASDGIHDERLQECAESVASDVDPKDSRTRQEHADNLSPPDAPPPRSPDSSASFTSNFSVSSVIRFFE